MSGSEGSGRSPSADGSQVDAGTDALHIRTFLIADVRGWTVFTQEHGDEGAGKLAAKFARLVREVVEGRGGKLLELRGDEAMCVFGSPRQAIRAAADLQERFVDETIVDPELPLTVGVGLDAGEAVEVEGGYRGGALNLAARLCSQALAGEILASREVAHLARRVEGVTYQDRGSISLKGLSEPVAFVRVVSDGVDPVERLSPYAPIRAPEPRVRHRPPWPAVVAAALALILIAVGLPILLGGEEVVPEANSVARVDPTDGSIGLATQLDARPGASVFGFDSVWVVHPDRAFVSRLDAEDGAIQNTAKTGNSPTDVAIGEGSVWVTNAADGTVTRIDPDTNEPTDLLEVGLGPSGIAVGAGALWIADGVSSELHHVPLGSGDPRTVSLPAGPSDVGFTPGGVWVTSATAGSVTRIDPSSLAITAQVTVGNGPTAILPAFGSIWVANHLDGTVTRIEPSTGRTLATVPVGNGPTALAEAGGLLWVANEYGSSIVSLDASEATPSVAQPIAVGAEAGSMTPTEYGLWVAVGPSATSPRGGTLHFETSDRAYSLDPGTSYETTGWQVLSLTNDGLMGVRKTGGPRGADLVPDLASALPEVSPDGLTYRFPLEHGVLYSTGEPVRPEDFRFGLERAFRLSRDGAGLFTALPGALACNKRPKRCDLSDVIETEPDAITFHLGEPDPDFSWVLSLPFAYPVPVGTPIVDRVLDPVPATGPYEVIEADGKHIVMERNEFFEEWSAAAQPDGFVDRIEWTFPKDLPAAVDRVIRGDADALAAVLSSDSVAELRSTSPDQLIQAGEPFLWFLALNDTVPPFDDVQVRRAVSFAVDRGRVQRLLGGDDAMRVTCQFLPPYFPGYEAYCPYTVDPGIRWTAPDAGAAERSIQEAGVAETRVTIWTPGFLPGGLDATRYLEQVLEGLGFNVTVRVLEDTYFERLDEGRDDVQMFWMPWFADYPTPSGFISLLFQCEGTMRDYTTCDPAFDRAIAEAHALAETDPAAANAAWAALDRKLVDRAVAVPLTNRIKSYALSERVGNAQINPQWGLLLSRLWVQ